MKNNPKDQRHSKSPFYLGVDIGGTKCAVVLGNDRARVLDRLSFPTETKKGLGKTLDRLFHSVREVLDRNGLEPARIRRIGISCGGPLDTRSGMVLGPSNLPGWEKVPIIRLFEGRFRRPVRLENDANAGALAEWLFGAGKGSKNLVFLTFGTGLGAGLILDGKLYQGSNDMAGEVGHVRLEPKGPLGYGKKGSFEGFCSGAGIARMAQAEGFKSPQGRSITAKDVLEAARRGQPKARRILAQSGSYLGMGLSMIIDTLNPEIIVIGGIYARAERFLRPAALHVIQKEALGRSLKACRIVPAALGERIGDVASLCVALYEHSLKKKDKA